MTGNNKNIIAVLIEDGAAASYLIPLLKKTFNEKAEVRTISCEDILKRNILTKTDTLFIPGVKKASEKYRNGLGVEGGQKIRAWVKAGGTAVGLCHGGYLLTEEFHYADKYSKKLRIINSSCGIFEGIARGPIVEYTNHNDLKNPYIDHAVAKLAFNDATKGAACYAHGPWLELSDTVNKDEYKIIARFEDVKNNPIAMASRNFGKGKAVFCSVVPEISGTEMATMDINLLPKNTPNAAHLKTGIRFAKELAAHENERQTVWNRLIMEIS